MGWHEYRQNNSGGSFTGQYIRINVEADTAREADSIAERHDVYFDGDGDCPCCGDRWYRSWDDGADEPEPPIAKYDWGMKTLNVPAEGAPYEPSA